MTTTHHAQLVRSDTDLVRFRLVRAEDVIGISGTGRVAGGVIFPDGTVARRWNTGVASTAVYDSIDDVETIHGHNGASVIELVDGRQPA
ncbi:hypothetical protein [Streptomyces malaysiensis]|uniref:Uncharacterized protein n=1 Tax=Streptomyces malaysiensis TaxID=92644 RepID=A0A7X6B007_STRMQ|nr:hypothetical protein [Streptomyces malaysiensis]NIY68001.1 hypothetical protein [Streptomyces malaysiensis]